jgi:hypothetical protein
MKEEGSEWQPEIVEVRTVSGQYLKASRLARQRRLSDGEGMEW